MPHGDKACWDPDCDKGKIIPSQALTAAGEGCAALALTATPLLMSLIGA